MPRSLARAGFEVSLLAPRGSLALHSRFVARTSVLRDESTPMQWLLSLVAMITEVEPRLVVPCDEVAIRLLFELVRNPPRHLGGNGGTRVMQLVRESLGDPACYETSIDKTMLPSAAEALGVPVPPYALAGRVDEAVERADAIGFPVVLKRRYGFASQGVRILQHRDELRQAADVLLQPTQLDLGVRRAPTLLVQGFVDGPMLAQTMVAWEGVPLAGFARRREVAFTPGKGASAVVRVCKVPSIRDFTERLSRALGMSGFFSFNTSSLSTVRRRCCSRSIAGSSRSCTRTSTRVSISAERSISVSRGCHRRFRSTCRTRPTAYSCPSRANGCAIRTARGCAIIRRIFRGTTRACWRR